MKYMKADPILLLKIGGEGGFIEIYQEGDVYVYHSDESALKDLLSEEDAKDIEFDSRERFASLEDAISRVNIGALKNGTITYINDDMAFEIKLLIHQRVKDL